MKIEELSVEGCLLLTSELFETDKTKTIDVFSTDSHLDLINCLYKEGYNRYIVPFKFEHSQILIVKSNTITFATPEDSGFLIKPLLNNENMKLSFELCDNEDSSIVSIGNDSELYVRNSVNVSIESEYNEMLLLIYSKNKIKSL